MNGTSKGKLIIAMLVTGYFFVKAGLKHMAADEVALAVDSSASGGPAKKKH